jgi:4-amino-4-deoxy-L-arabinose transferase-like glycosyltransferase
MSLVNTPLENFFTARRGSARLLDLSPERALAIVVVAALALRALGAFWFRGMIDGEGAEYGRLAENLLAGAGYVGIATPGDQLFFPPLYPMLIAALSVVTGDTEVAGRLLSVVAGSLTVIPVYLIARRLYDGRIAMLAAILTGLHPFLVQFSSTMFCEPTYLALILTAIYVAMRAMDNATPGNLLAMGLLFGAAYLIRQEAFAYAVIGSVIVGLHIWFQGTERTKRLAWLSLVGLGFALLAGPYIAWISVESGQFRLQGKSAPNIQTESRIQAGQTSDQAAYSVAPDLTPTGTWMVPSAQTLQTFKIETADLIKVLLVRAKVVLMDASNSIAGNLEFGSPFLFGLAFLGLFAVPWTLRLLIPQTYVLMLLGLVPFGLLFTYVLGPRFYFLFLPFMCIWASVGIMKIGGWARRTAALCGTPSSYLPMIGSGMRLIAILSILLPAAGFAAWRLKDAHTEWAFRQAISELKATETAPMHFADTSTQAAFHAEADFVWLPYADETTALRYMEKVGVTHVVLRPDVGERPYLQKWIDEGVPGARRVADVTSAKGVRLQVYKLDR